MPPEERRFEKKDLAGCMGVLTQMRQATVLGLAFFTHETHPKKCHRVVSTPPTFSDVKTKMRLFSKKLTFDFFPTGDFLAPLQWKKDLLRMCWLFGKKW